MRKQNRMLIVLAMLVLLSALCLLFLPPSKKKMMLGQPMDKQTFFLAMEEGEIGAIWYDVKTQTLHGALVEGGKSLRDLPDNADFFLHIDKTEFWDSARKMAQERPEAMQQAESIAFGRVIDRASFWIRYKTYVVICLALGALAVVLISWLAFRRRRAKKRK